MMTCLIVEGIISMSNNIPLITRMEMLATVTILINNNYSKIMPMKMASYLMGAIL
jgi:hypothetical protein